MHGVAILGSTGSIGRSTLDVIARHPVQFRAVALAAHRSVDTMFEQCVAHRPRLAAMLDPLVAAQLRDRVRDAGLPVRVLSGPQGLVEVATTDAAKSVMAAIVGAAGLLPTLEAARLGRRVLLANKEALVMAGGVFMEAVRASGAVLLPIDSEHNAVFQSLPRDYSGDMDSAGVRRILLTASGGPLRSLPLERFASVTPAQAVAHPNWVMGRKISVDSATMMNKGLEVIEAHWLFGAPRDRIEVVIHPQSVIHSMVEYVDGSVIAQLGNPDMRTPIAHALAYPDRVNAGVNPLDLARVGTLSFEAPDERRFPCLRLAYHALERGGSAIAALNAANEVAVEQFLSGALPFHQIAPAIERVLDRTPDRPLRDLDEVLDEDQRARREARSSIAALA